MIVAVDTSGKIDQLPMWIGVVKPIRRGILDNLRKSVGERVPVLLTRRRLDGKYLNQEEIKTLKKNVNFSTKVLRAPLMRLASETSDYFTIPRCGSWHQRFSLR